MSHPMKARLLLLTLAWTAQFAFAQQDQVHDHGQAADTVDAPAPVDHSQHMPAPVVEPEPIDHSQHQPAVEPQATAPMVHDHDAMSAEPESTAVEHSHLPDEDLSALRDPHAYANGYTLDSGPYLLESGHRITHADEMTFAGLWMDRFEYVARDGEDATEFEGHVWRGDSYNRVLLRTEAAVVDGKVEDAEIDLMLSRAVSPFWDLQFGLRHQIMNDHHRHWAVIGLNGLAPYWLEVDASLFASENGQLFYDLEAEYELRLTQRLVLQPRIDIHSFNKADEELGHGEGLSKLKLGARLRYEFSRRFAPYVGVERVSSYGETADLLPIDVERNQTWWTLGVKFWF